MKSFLSYTLSSPLNVLLIVFGLCHQALAVDDPQLGEKDKIKAGLHALSVEHRNDLIHRAKILDPKMTKIHDDKSISKISVMDLLEKTCGNSPTFSYPLEANQKNTRWPKVRCEYQKSDKVLGGSTNKFLCNFKYEKESGKVKIKTQKVKYLPTFGGVQDAELTPSILSGYIAKLVGFHATLFCPAHIICEKCSSAHPYEFGKGQAAPSEQEFKFPNSIVEVEADLTSVIPNIPRSNPRRAHGVEFIEALKIAGDDLDERKSLAIEREVWLLWLNFLVEMDPIPSNQKLGCAKGEILENGQVTCKKPFIYTTDYGRSFFHRFHFDRWKTTPALTLNADGTCTGGMTLEHFKEMRGSKTKDIFMQPIISQEAKEILENRLLAITDQQWMDLARVANLDRLYKLSPEEFLSAVKSKIEDLTKIRCPGFGTRTSLGYPL